MKELPAALPFVNDYLLSFVSPQKVRGDKRKLEQERRGGQEEYPFNSTG